MNQKKSNFETKVLAEIVVFAALSAVLYVVRPYSNPYGGSITLGSMVPVMWLSLRRGVRFGLVAGVIFGLLALPIDVILLPYSPIMNPVQAILEYPIAFGVLGLAGIFHRKTTAPAIVGVGISVLVKLFLHVIAGIIFWISTIPEGWIPIVYALVYNGSFLLPEFIISAVLMYILLKKGTLEYGL
ncbi:MAG: energy-coupled thiamine transporter ThiT [Candidatus Bathyarchaeota archaeon]|nr:MAG: energy-coupled thiamine transporter ThiT [Candidatus Bathyarchaeota archaeon]